MNNPRLLVSLNQLAFMIFTSSEKCISHEIVIEMLLKGIISIEDWLEALHGNIKTIYNSNQSILFQSINTGKYKFHFYQLIQQNLITDFQHITEVIQSGNINKRELKTLYPSIYKELWTEYTDSKFYRNPQCFYASKTYLEKFTEITDVGIISKISFDAFNLLFNHCKGYISKDYLSKLIDEKGLPFHSKMKILNTLSTVQELVSIYPLLSDYRKIEKEYFFELKGYIPSLKVFTPPSKIVVKKPKAHTLF